MSLFLYSLDLFLLILLLLIKLLYSHRNLISLSDLVDRMIILLFLSKVFHDFYFLNLIFYH